MLPKKQDKISPVKKICLFFCIVKSNTKIKKKILILDTNQIEELILWSKDPEWNKILVKHATDNPLNLAFRLKNQTNIPLKLLLNQLTLRQKASLKMPTWLKANCIFDERLFEQATNEELSNYRANLLNQVPKKVLDLTAGFGIDAFVWINKGAAVTMIEPNAHHIALLKHNLHILKVSNFNIINSTAEAYLEQEENHSFDLIFVDPDRRTADGDRMHALADTSPNVLKLWPNLCKITKVIWIKVSPMIDLNHVTKSISNLTEIHVIAFKNEVKEVLLSMQTENKGNSLIYHAHNILPDKKTEQFAGYLIDWNSVELANNNEGYFYEPNRAVLKAGLTAACFKQYNIRQLGRDLVYGVSNNYNPNFPGRKFFIVEKMAYDLTSLKKRLKDKKNKTVNIAVRLFPITAKELCLKLGVKQGGSEYWFLFTNYLGQHLVYICKHYNETNLY